MRLAQAAASTQRPDELLELIIRETTSAIGTDVCSLYLVTPPGRQLSLTATNGLNENMVGKVLMRVGEGITGWVAESREPAIVPDVSQEPHWKWVHGLDEDRFHSMLSVPVESGPRLVGVINVQSTERRDFTPGDVDFLRAIAGQVAGILERSELQRRTEEQLAEIQLSHDIHERFTRLSLEGAGLRSILDVVGSLAGGHAALYSVDGYRFRGAGQAADGLPQRIHVPNPRAPGGAREVRINFGRPPKSVDVVPVRAGSDLLGLLAVSVDETTVDSEGRRRALEHGSTVLALELSKERAAAEVERRLRGDLVEEVLAGGLEADEAERVARQAERLGHRLPQRAWVMVLEPDDDDTESALGAPGHQDRLDDAMSGLIRSRLPGALTLVRSASAVFLVPDEVAPDLATVEKLAGQVLAAGAPVMKPGTCSVGIGNLANGVSELARSHVEARQALRLTRRAGGRGRVASYRSLGAFRLLLEVQSPRPCGISSTSCWKPSHLRAVARYALARNAGGSRGRPVGAPCGCPQPRHPHQLDELPGGEDRVPDRPAAGRPGNAGRDLDRLTRPGDARHLAGQVRLSSPSIRWPAKATGPRRRPWPCLVSERFPTRPNTA